MNQEQWNLLLIALAQRVYQLEQRIKILETAHGCKTDCSSVGTRKASSKRALAGVLPGP
jgi:hypothetical protein